MRQQTMGNPATGVRHVATNMWHPIAVGIHAKAGRRLAALGARHATTDSRHMKSGVRHAVADNRHATCRCFMSKSIVLRSYGNCAGAS